jgi:hypothetical protein
MVKWSPLLFLFIASQIFDLHLAASSPCVVRATADLNKPRMLGIGKLAHKGCVDRLHLVVQYTGSSVPPIRCTVHIKHPNYTLGQKYMEWFGST